MCSPNDSFCHNAGRMVRIKPDSLRAVKVCALALLFKHTSVTDDDICFLL